MKKDKVMEMYAMIIPEGNARVFVDHMFRIFDNDSNGSIEFTVRPTVRNEGV